MIYNNDIHYNNERANKARMFTSHPQYVISAKHRCFKKQIDRVETSNLRADGQVVCIKRAADESSKRRLKIIGLK